MVVDPPLASTLWPGDVVSVELQTTPARAYSTLEVGSTGAIHVPGLGDVTVGGLTQAQAESRVLDSLRQQDAHAGASLRVTRPAGRRVTILGAVTKQGVYPIVAGMRVADAIAAAGGPLAAAQGSPGGRGAVLADLSKASVLRNGATLPINLDEALRGAPSHNVYVHPGDLIQVPARDGNVSVFGQVNGPASLPHHEGMRLTEALALAGGVTVDGDKSDIRLIRGPVETPEVYSASLEAIVDGEGQDVALAPGDVLFVTDKPLEDVREVFGLLAPFVGLASTALLLAIVSAQ